MSSEQIQLHNEAKKAERKENMALINKDPSKALEIGRKNFCLSGINLVEARHGKHFLLIKDMNNSDDKSGS